MAVLPAALFSVPHASHVASVKPPAVHSNELGAAACVGV